MDDVYYGDTPFNKEVISISVDIAKFMNKKYRDITKETAFVALLSAAMMLCIDDDEDRDIFKRGLVDYADAIVVRYLSSSVH